MEIKKDLSKLSYQELETEEENTLKKLSEADLPLDDASKYYEYGKKVLLEMTIRLDKLSKSVTDKVKE